MSLATLQTRIVTQVADTGSGILAFLAVSFRTWTWRTVASTPTQLVAVTLDCVKRDAIVIASSSLCFVCDGGGNNFLYSVDTTNPLAPVVLDSIDLSAP